ncbi:hypothetical protein [Pragia fontium]|uniref:hypothetical protein n=1 Tax=Pragia fontium TaxID=82985 RepID=UPI00069C095B|nr:hypothetical protein [Pragia fontium]
MKYLIDSWGSEIIAISMIAMAGPVAYAQSASDMNAVLFVDSALIQQQTLITEINEALYYSPTLQSQLHVQVIDINPDGHVFNGALDYSYDKSGEWVAKYRPGKLPYLVCLRGDKTTFRQELYQASEIRECVTKG